MEEKIYFLKGSTPDTCAFLYNNETIVEGITCPANVDRLCINVRNFLDNTPESTLEHRESPLKIKILFSSYKEENRILLAITTVSGKKVYTTVDGLLARPQGEEAVLLKIGDIKVSLVK